MKQLSFVDLFCGAGGLSLGLKSAGFVPVYACDRDALSCDTYRTNIGNHVFCEEVTLELAKTLCNRSGLHAGELALVAGGPPCQGFSLQRRGSRQDPRNGLVVTYTHVALALRPRFILIENVPGLLGVRGKAELEETQILLDREGYDSKTALLNAADFGVPQIRRRAFVVAWDRAHTREFSFPTPRLTPAEWRTVRNAIEELPEPPSDFTEHPSYANHRRVRMSERNIERIRYVPEGGGREDIPRRLQLPCHLEDNGHRHLDVYGRMEFDKPSPTITAMFDNFTRGRFAHPIEDRSITAREGARLQSFPDSFRFIGPKKEVARQIGNAVPPQLAEAIGLALRESLSDP